MELHYIVFNHADFKERQLILPRLQLILSNWAAIRGKLPKTDGEFHGAVADMVAYFDSFADGKSGEKAFRYRIISGPAENPFKLYHFAAANFRFDVFTQHLATLSRYESVPEQEMADLEHYRSLLAKHDDASKVKCTVTSDAEDIAKQPKSLATRLGTWLGRGALELFSFSSTIVLAKQAAALGLPVVTLIPLSIAAYFVIKYHNQGLAKRLARLATFASTWMNTRCKQFFNRPVLANKLALILGFMALAVVIPFSAALAWIKNAATFSGLMGRAFTAAATANVFLGHADSYIKNTGINRTDVSFEPEEIAAPKAKCK